MHFYLRLDPRNKTLERVSKKDLQGFDPYQLYSAEKCPFIIIDEILVDVSGRNKNSKEFKNTVKIRFFNRNIDQRFRKMFLQAIIDERGFVDIKTNYDTNISEKLLNEFWGTKNSKERNWFDFLTFVDLIDQEYKKEPDIKEYKPTVIHGASNSHFIIESILGIKY